MLTVSVLIPFYNVEKYIELCARSIFEQTYINLDIIFIDDHSIDRSAEIVKNLLMQYPSRIPQTRIIQQKKNLGISFARNNALYNAMGEYVFYVDGDDYISINTIDLFVKKALETNADMIFGNFILNKKNQQIEKKEFPYEDKDKLIRDVLLKRHSCQIWNKLIKKKLFVKNNIYFPDGINNGEDYIVLPKLLLFANKIAFIETCTYYYDRTNINSIQANMGNRNYDFDGVKGNENLYDFFCKYDSSFVKYVSAMLLQCKVEYLLWVSDYSIFKIKVKQFVNIKYKYLFYLPFKYILIIILDFVHLYFLIFLIGKKIQKDNIR